MSSTDLRPAARFLAPAGLARPTLAVGAHRDTAFAIAAGTRAIASHPIGDLDHPAAYRGFASAVARYEQMFGVPTERVVCDRNPEYASTRWARARASTDGLELIEVQHHTAHVLSCLAEHDAEIAPAIGVAFDRGGYGDDAAIWGGEVLIWDGATMRRDTHLAYVGMPGGETAGFREPWRMAVSHLAAAGANVDASGAPSPLARDAALALIANKRNAPRTSSMGRLFDAIAAVARVAPTRAAAAGESAHRLEGLAAGVIPSGGYPVAIGPRGIDASAIVAEAAADASVGTPPEVIARRFHTTVVELIAVVCERARARTGIERVALSGDVFANAIVLAEARARLVGGGFTVLSHEKVPTHDGGLWLGQLAYAAARDRVRA